jgi:predicted dehydrogenase
MPVSSIRRRAFLKTTAAAVLGFPAILRAANLNSSLQVCAVGASGKGLSDISEVGSHPKVRFAGFCDVDSARFAQADKRFPEVPHFQDFREMLASVGDKCDAVIVSTPDHLHAPVAMAALQRRKHVYCQKPLTHTVWEARQLRLAAGKAGVATQMGNQIHSAAEYRTAVKLLRDGVIGKIKEVHSFHPNHGNHFTRLTQPPPAAPVPATLNWDLWLGPAPLRDYAPDVYHPFKWRDWQDFGGGTMGDFGCHILDPIFTALELGTPLTIRAETEGLNAQTWPAAETVRYVFPGNPRTAGSTLPITWHNGGRRPDATLAQMPPEAKLPGAGSIIVGEKAAMVLPHVGMPQVYSEGKVVLPMIEKVPGASHYHAWVDAALAGAQTTDNFAYAGLLTEAVQLGNVATRVPGVTLEWDAAALRFPNHPAADRLLTKSYRAGWQLDAAS